MLDRYILGRTDRISQEAPVPIVSVESEFFIPGGAANVAVNINELGANSTLIGIIGKDYAGSKIKNLLTNKKKIRNLSISVSSRPTIEKIRLIASNNQIARIDREKIVPINSSVEKKIIRIVKQNIRKWDGIIISDYAKGMITAKLAQEIIKIAKDNKKPVFADTKPANFYYFKNASLIKPNYKESFEFTGLPNVKDSAKYITDKLNCNVLITQGDKGMTLYADRQLTNLPAIKTEVADIVGAGDTVVAAIMLSFVSGANFKDSAHIANHAASIVVRKMGTSSSSLEELRYSLKNVKTSKEN